MSGNFLETFLIEQEAGRCEDSEDLREILAQYDAHYLSWQSCINRLLDESGLSYNRFAEKCGISKNTLKKWCVEGGAPRCRNTFLKIGFGLGMEQGQIDRLLVRYGGYHGLYPKDLFDAVCIYVLKKRADGDERYSYAYAEALYERCLSEGPVEDADYLSTALVREQILGIDTEEDFVAFAEANSGLLSGKREKLNAYLRDFIALHQNEMARIAGTKVSLHAAASYMGLPPRFEKILSNLTRHGRVPRREQLIALGLHLEMTPAELDRLLVLADMEGLCAKNRLECILIYALQSLCLLHPELPFSNATQLLAVTKDPEIRRQCRETVEEYTSRAYLCDQREAEAVSDYVRGILEEMDVEEATELLRLL